jgi:sugar/nucleoside kinase (ribokinase family)
VTELAAIGHLSRDVVAGGAPRPGGGVFHATRALARLRADAIVAAACAEADRDALLAPLEALGLPVTWLESSTTTAFAFHYEGDRRVMWLESVGDPWQSARAVEAVADAGWVHVAALTRSDFPPDVLAALATGRKLLLDAQGLVRIPTPGALRTDGELGDALRHVEILKLDEEEAQTLAGGADPHRLRSLGVPEVLLTLGSRGSVVVLEGLVERIAAPELAGPVDPTGAGDAYAAAYLVSRARGAAPVEAARAAATTVADLLSKG